MNPAFLTKREILILQGAAEGLKDTEIAEVLRISKRALWMNWHRLYKKTDSTCRGHALYKWGLHNAQVRPEQS